MLFRKLAQLALVFTFILSSFVIFTNVSEAATRPYDGTDPMKTICYKDARTVDYKIVKLDDRVDTTSRLELRYSPKCRTIWARIIKHGDPNWIGTAKIVRSFDRKEFYCVVPQNGTSCYTKQVNDRNVTSYAFASYTNPRTDEKRTAVTRSY